MWFHDSQKMSLIKILNMSIGNRCMKPFMNACFSLHIWIVDLRRQGSVYRKIFWTRLWSPISISRPLGREIEKLEIGLVQKIFRYTDPFTLRSSIHIGKVQTFWEAHKIWKQFPHGLDVYKGNVQTMRKIFPNFVCLEKVRGRFFFLYLV